MDTRQQAKLDGLYFFLAGSIVFLSLGLLFRSLLVNAPLKAVDFKATYYASQALLHCQDPYSEDNLFRAYSAAANRDQFSAVPPVLVQAITLCVNLPPTLVLLTPFALLPWPIANFLWTALIGIGLIFSVYLMWRVSAAWSSRVAGILGFIFLAGSVVLLETGNAAGIVVSLCIIAAAAIMHNRFARVGVVLLAISLLIKPQDAGLVWLYFLLAGGQYRRRALQTLAITAVVFLGSAAWVHSASPHWIEELRANLASTSLPGHVNDPSPQAIDPEYHGSMIVSLQTVSSIFFGNPGTYNLVAYLVCAPLLLIWAFTTLRARRTVENAWLALAAIAPLSMLPLYHRQHDTRLMILAIPACALLWAKRGTAGRLAVAVTTLAALLSSNLVVQILGMLTFNARASAVGLSKQLLTLTLARPMPITMLLMALFFCWYWARQVFSNKSLAKPLTLSADNAGSLMIEPASTE